MGTYVEEDMAQSPVEMTAAEREQSPMPDRGSLPPITLTAMVPKELARYTAKDDFVPTFNHLLAPLHFCDPHVPLVYLPEGWSRYMHPEGNAYYRHEALQVVTDLDVCDQRQLARVLAACDIFILRMKTLPETIAPELRFASPTDYWHCGMGNWELFIEENPKQEGEFRYYVSDWDRQCLFWVEHEEVYLCTTLLDLDSAASYDHVLLMLRWQFWRHVEYFPAHRPPPEGSVEELRALLLYAVNDRMTSVESTISYSVEDLRQFLQFLPERPSNDPRCSVYITSIIARHWIEIWDNRMHNLHGHPAVRLSRRQSRFFEPTRPRELNIFAQVVSIILLFNQPKTFYHQLCETWIDRTVYIDQWRKLLRAMQEEWTTTGFMATVILATNMGFLSIDKLENVDLPTVSQTASIVSTILSIGSILSGMLLIRRHREIDTEWCTAQEANEYMTACAYYKWTGLFGAAALFSAPRALLLWSLLLFVSGLLSFSLWRWSIFYSPFIAFATFSITIVILVQLWYFNTRLTKDKHSKWKLPPQYQYPSDRQPPPSHLSTLWSDTADQVKRRLSLATTMVGSPLAGDSTSPRSPWGHLVRKLSHRLGSPPADVEVGVHAPDPDGSPGVQNSPRTGPPPPEHIELQYLPERPATSRRRSTGLSYSEEKEYSYSLPSTARWDESWVPDSWVPEATSSQRRQLQLHIPDSGTPAEWLYDGHHVWPGSTYSQN